jgi:hypothetical protein
MNYTTQQLGINHDDLFSVITFVLLCLFFKNYENNSFNNSFFIIFHFYFQGGGVRIKLLKFYTNTIKYLSDIILKQKKHKNVEKTLFSTTARHATTVLYIRDEVSGCVLVCNGFAIWQSRQSRQCCNPSGNLA